MGTLDKNNYQFKTEFRKSKQAKIEKKIFSTQVMPLIVVIMLIITVRSKFGVIYKKNLNCLY